MALAAEKDVEALVDYFGKGAVEGKEADTAIAQLHFLEGRFGLRAHHLVN